MKDIKKEIVNELYALLGTVDSGTETKVCVSEAKSRLDKLYAEKYAQAIIKVCEDSKKT